MSWNFETRFQVIEEVPHSSGFDEHEIIPVGTICDFVFDMVPIITYKGKMICDYDSDMAKEYFKQI